MITSPLPGGAIGIGWRREICGIIADLDGLGFCEVIAESLGPQHGLRGRAGKSRELVVPEELIALIERGIPAVPHGVSLSLGGAEAVDEHRVAHLAKCAQALGAPLVSEHIAFVRAGGMEAGHLLPVPRTREALDALERNILRTRRELEVPLAVENIAALFEWPDAEYSEAEFLQELTERTGVYLLLDIANIYANARNRSRDPLTELLRLPTERLAYCHVAGGHVSGGRYHDTHSDRVPPEVLALVSEFTNGREVPLMLERDGNYPAATELAAELGAIAAAAGRPPITLRGARPPNATDRLAARQVALVRALTAGEQLEPGFDAGDVSAAAHALLHKRADEVAGRFPLLAHACGPDFRARYVEWARGRPKTGTVADAAAFARDAGLPEPGSRTTRWSLVRRFAGRRAQ